MTMTETQRQAYVDNLSLTFSDRVMNMVFEEAPEWRFVDIRVDYGWKARKTHPERSAHLECVCGRQLRYQYRLVSTDGRNRHINLGSNHFMQHLGIPAEVAQEVFHQFNQVQKTMDEMLVRYSRGERFPSGNNARNILMGKRFGNYSPSVFKRLRWHAVADFPLSKKDKKRVRKLVAEYNRIQNQQSKPVWILKNDEKNRCYAAIHGRHTYFLCNR